jgi:hypothetical protein
MSFKTLFLCVRDGTPYLKEIPAGTLDSSTFPHTINNFQENIFFFTYAPQMPQEVPLLTGR